MDSRKIKIQSTLRPAPQFHSPNPTDKIPTQLQQETAFTIFSKLSLELQLLIWEEAVNFARIIRIEDSHVVLVYPDGRIDSTKNIVAKGRIPAILHACRQSRKVGLKVYQLITKKYCDDPFYINLNVDAILMPGTSELQALWTHHDYWFPESRDKPVFGEKLPILILDPSRGSDSQYSPKDPERDFAHDARRILRPGYSGLFVQFIFCFENIVILQPRSGSSIEERAVYEKFKYKLWKDVMIFVNRAKTDKDIAKKLPVWLKEGVKLWSQSRFQRRVQDGKWNSR